MREVFPGGDVAELPSVLLEVIQKFLLRGEADLGVTDVGKAGRLRHRRPRLVLRPVESGGGS